MNIANRARKAWPAANGPAASRTVPVQITSMATRSLLATALRSSKLSAFKRALPRARVLHGLKAPSRAVRQQAIGELFLHHVGREEGFEFLGPGTIGQAGKVPSGDFEIGRT